MGLSRAAILWCAAATAIAAPAIASPAFDPAPWLSDLAQAQRALEDKYANLEWAESERGIEIDALFAESAARLRRATSDAAARAVFDRIPRKLGDGHVVIDWPNSPPGAPSAAPPPEPDFCGKLGYSANQNKPGTAQAIDGYRPLPGAPLNPLPAGTIVSNGTKVGIIRIGIFQPQGYPELCHAALRAMPRLQGKDCDLRCEDEILTFAYRELTLALERRIRQLQAAGARVMMVDITTNGGGSEWAEAAARMFSMRPLRSSRRGFVRGPHWAKQWADLAAELRAQSVKANPVDRERLARWAEEADAARRDAETPCPRGAACSRIATAGFSVGLVGDAPSGTLPAKDWGPLIFNPAQFAYRDGVWDGPVIVLTDQETWSAAEQFAAVLQDNRAALIMGARTGGAGCGHTYGGTPTKLKNSGAVLKLPDCVRYRADGSNEVRGIIPDEVVPFRFDDGAKFKARLVAERLPGAIARLVSAPR